MLVLGVLLQVQREHRRMAQPVELVVLFNLPLESVELHLLVQQDGQRP